MNKDNPKDYGNEIFDVDEVAGQDLKLNPDYFFHTAEIRLQQVLAKENFQEGILQYQMITNHIEMIAKARKLIPNDYLEKLKAFEEKAKKDREDKKADEAQIGLARARLKLELIYGQVFSSGTVTGKLKF